MHGIRTWERGFPFILEVEVMSPQTSCTSMHGIVRGEELDECSSAVKINVNCKLNACLNFHQHK